MIEVKNLCKYFKKRNTPVVKALDDVSFKLPNTGFVFVIGKSGSGKTTLLSLIGGLDKITKGDIIVDGKNFNDFSRRDFDNYRNNYTGFIFQDYHLFEDLTIYDNIKMMLDFKKDKDLSKISKALASVGLAGYESRYPRELSGGEKQRVAIARVIVKDPKVILADEPTGNLDHETTKQILGILKDLSKNKLVLIVSHNEYDAYESADRVINLQFGKVIGEYLYNNEIENSLHVEDGVLYTPRNKNVTDKEIVDTIDAIKENEIKDVKQIQLSFLPYDESKDSFTYLDSKIENNHMSIIENIKYGFMLYKNQFIKSLIFSIICAILFTILGISVHLFNLNREKLYENYLNENELHDVSLVKNFRYDDSLVSNSQVYGTEYMTKDELDIIDGYCSKYYPSYKFHDTYVASYDVFSNYKPEIENIVSVDDEFLIEKFGIDNKLEFVAKAKEEAPGLFYITDFFADSIIHYLKLTWNQNCTYDDLIKGFNIRTFDYKFNGIIKTNYLEKYKKFVPYFFSSSDSRTILKNFDAKEYEEMYNELNNYYMTGYSYSKTPVVDYYRYNHSNISFQKVLLASFNDNHDIITQNLVISHNQLIPELCNLKDDEIVLDIPDFKELTGITDLDLNAKVTLIDNPIEIEITSYNKMDSDFSNPYKTNKYKVVGYTSTKYTYMNINTLLKLLDPYLTRPNKVYLKDSVDDKLIYDDLSKLDITIASSVHANYVQAERFIDVIGDLFKFIFIVLFIMIAILIVFYTIRVVKNKMFEIGVMKSLGARDSDIVIQILVNILSTSILLILFYNILEVVFTGFINNVLIKAINNVSGKLIFYDSFNVICFKPSFLVITDLIIFVSLLISVIVPYIKLRYLKPTNIIKAKE